MPDSKIDWGKVGALAAVVGAVATVGALLITILSLITGEPVAINVLPDDQTPGPSFASVGSTTPKVTAVPTTSTTYVEALQIVSERDVTGKGTVNASGQKFNHGIALSDLAFSNDPDSAVLALPEGFGSFRAVVGIDPNSSPGFPGSGGARVFVDGARVVDTVVSAESPACGIDVSIDGGTRLELQAYIVSGERKDVAFGDARVVGSADFPGEPSPPSCR